MNLSKRCVMAAVTSALMVAPAFMGVTGAQPACPSGALSMPAGQPVDGTTLKVARVAGAHVGVAAKWEMKFDAFICNKTASDAVVNSVKIEHLSGSTVTKTKMITTAGSALLHNTVKAGEENWPVFVRDHTQFDFPLPTQIRLTITACQGNCTACQAKCTAQRDTCMAEVGQPGGPLASQCAQQFSGCQNSCQHPGVSNTVTFERTYAVAEHVNPGSLGGFFFPSQQSDLPAGSFWGQHRHADDNTFQRYAYDLGVYRWDETAKVWTDRKAGASLTSKAKEDFGSFDIPVYAMSDGQIVGCNRGAADHDAQAASGNVPGGNLLWIRTGNETQLYAHLKQNSIPSSLCPHSDDAEHVLDPPITVQAGQLVGRSGSSGSSLGGPHLHIHTFMGLPKILGGSETGFDSDSRPMRFVQVKVQELKPKTNLNTALWNNIGSAATLPYETLIVNSSASQCQSEAIACQAKCTAQRDTCMAEVGQPGGPLASQCAQQFSGCKNRCNNQLKQCTKK